MAQKQYSFDFVLNAVLNGGFSAAFTKAQQEFIRLGAEIKNLQAIQRDVKAYEKQAAAVQNTTQKLGNLTRQYQKLGGGIEESKNKTAVLGQEKDRINKRIQEESAKLEELRRKYDATDKEISKAKGSTRSLEAEKRRLVKSIEQNQATLDRLNSEYAKNETRLADSKKSTAALEQKQIDLGRRIGDTEAALEKQKQKLGETKDRLDAAGVSTSDLAAKDAELTAKIQGLTEEQKKAAEGAGSFGNAGVQAIEVVGGAIAAAGIANAMKSIADAYMECVEVAGDFEQAMSAVEAIADANTTEMGALTAEAKELGATTKFTAQQSANAMEYMAMAGWDAQEMLNGMDGVINLAAAAGEDLAQVSDIVTDNLSAFGLQASDTAHFADVLAAAAANSNTNISIMGETFKSSSSVAGALGYSIEDVAVMVGLMANNAVKGSRAGTALRNIFNGMLGGVTLTAEAFGELDYSAVNFDGSMKGLMETVGDLRGYFEQMTEAEKVNNAMAIAGMRGYNGLLAILNATDEDFQNLYSSINDCSGAAERMAKVKLDNLNGDITIANSAMEALQSTIGEQFNPELRELTQLKTELLNGMNDFIIENPALVKGAIAGGAAFLGLGGTIVGVNAAIKAFKALDLATLLTGPAGVAVGVIAGIAGVTAAVVALNEAAKDSLDESWELTAASREQYERLQELNSAYDRAVELYGENSYEAQQLRWQIEDMNAAYEDGRQTFEEYTAAHEAAMDSYRAVAEAREEASASVGNEAESIGALVDQLAKWSGSASEAAAHQGEIQAIVDRLNESLPGLNLSYSDVASGSDKFIASLRNTAQAEADAKRLAQEYENYVNSLAQRGVLESEKNSAAEQVRLATEDYQRAQEAYDEAADMYRSDATGIGYYFGTREEAAALDAAREQLNTYQDILDETTAAYEENEAAIRSSEDAIQGRTNAQGDAAAQETAVREVLGETMASLQELAKAYTDTYDEAMESFSGQFGLFDEAQADMDATVEAAQEALDSQLAYWRGYAENISALKEKSAEELGVTQENYDALMEYVRSGTPEAAGLAADMVEAMNGGNTQALTDLANTLGEIRESQEEAAGDVAEWTTGLNEQMDQLIKEMEEDITELDMSKEAYDAGLATIQSYIDAATSPETLAQIQSAYANISHAAVGAMAVAAFSTGGGASERGFASGTDDAPPGWAWVGEDGPELMRMHGGEQVLPNTVSQRVAEEYEIYRKYTAAENNEVPVVAQPVASAQPELAVIPAPTSGDGGGTSVPPVNVTFQINGNATQETVQDLRSFSDDIVRIVLDAIDERQEDEKRCAMR